MKVAVTLEYSQPIDPNEVESFREVSPEKLKEIISAYEANILELISNKLKGEEVVIETRLIDEDGSEI